MKEQGLIVPDVPSSVNVVPTSIWRLPKISMRFFPVYRRHLLVWRKLAISSILGNIADPLITLVAFGYGLGQLLPTVAGMPYIVFLAAGSLCMSTMMAASFEALYSAFSRMHVQKTWESIMNAPIELDDVLAAEWLWAATKSLFSAIAILVVMVGLGISRQPTLLGVLPVVMLVGLTFSALGLCFNALASGYDSFSYYFTLVLTPMIFVSGVYYPMSNLPEWLSLLAAILPLASAVDLVRPLVVGQFPENALPKILHLMVFAVAAFYLALALTRRRFEKN
jgi:lipooligosaccharide transport system permease protein